MAKERTDIYYFSLKLVGSHVIAFDWHGQQSLAESIANLTKLIFVNIFDG